MTNSAIQKATDTLKAYIECFQLLNSKYGPVPHPKKKNLLFLTWAYPPDVTGGVYRPTSIVREAKNRGWNVTVFCGPATQDVSSAGRYLEQYVTNSGKVVRLKQSKLDPSHKFFYPKISGGFLNLLETIKQAKQAFQENPPSVIVASGPPFHNFAAARTLSKKFGIPYVLDYRDEWTECPFDFVEIGNTDRDFEKKCIQEAAAIVFTTPSHLRHQKQKFNIPDSKRLALIPNGWEAEDVPDENVVNPLPPSELRIAFVGHLGEHTLPESLLQSLERLFQEHPGLSERLRVSFVGSKSGSAMQQLNRFKYKKSLEVIDPVPKPVALRIMQDADGIILINEPRLERYRPGKLYDYIAMKTPIIVYGTGGEVENLVSELKVGVTIPIDDDQRLLSALSQLKDCRKTLDSPEIHSWLHRHQRSVLAGDFIDLLDAVATQEP